MLGHHAACAEGEDAVFGFGPMNEFIWGGGGAAGIDQRISDECDSLV